MDSNDFHDAVGSLKSAVMDHLIGTVKRRDAGGSILNGGTIPMTQTAPQPSLFTGYNGADFQGYRLPPQLDRTAGPSSAGIPQAKGGSPQASTGADGPFLSQAMMPQQQAGGAGLPHQMTAFQPGQFAPLTSALFQPQSLPQPVAPPPPPPPPPAPPPPPPPPVAQAPSAAQAASDAFRKWQIQDEAPGPRARGGRALG